MFANRHTQRRVYVVFVHTLHTDSLQHPALIRTQIMRQIKQTKTNNQTNKNIRTSIVMWTRHKHSYIYSKTECSFTSDGHTTQLIDVSRSAIRNLVQTRGTAGSDIWFACLADKPMVRSDHLRILKCFWYMLANRFSLSIAILPSSWITVRGG